MQESGYTLGQSFRSIKIVKGLNQVKESVMKNVAEANLLTFYPGVKCKISTNFLSWRVIKVFGMED